MMRAATPWFARGAARAAALLTLGMASHGARAQNVNSGIGIGPSQSLNAPGEPAPPPSEHVFGDWGGLRTRLRDMGLTLTLDLVAEFAGNPVGGLKQGSTYAGQAGFEATGDMQKVLGIRGLTTHLVLINRHGSPDSNLIGDHLNSTQEIYGAGGNVAVHLVYVYAEQSFARNRINIAVGRMPATNDFAASPLYCNFMNNALCGNPKLVPGSDYGFSSYPDSVWGGRVRVRPTPATYIQTVAYEVNQDLYGAKKFRTNFRFDTSGDSGVMFPLEAAYEPLAGAEKLPGHYKLGFAYDTTSNDATYYRNLADFRTGARGSGTKTQFWALADQLVLRTGPGDTDGLTLLAGYAHANPDLSNYAEQVFAGLLLRDFWRARPQDTIGFLANYTRVSGALTAEQELDQAFGLKLAGGATGRQTHAALIELNYDIHVLPGLNFQPEFQYYFRPNAQSDIKDAAVFGFKSHINF